MEDAVQHRCTWVIYHRDGTTSKCGRKAMYPDHMRGQVYDEWQKHFGEDGFTVCDKHTQQGYGLAQDIVIHRELAART